ncbi:transposable element Tcb1 transposase [Trichonephila clavipes]|nr:transposable element Tcb1 transposase [Trichonephila clavipes]
MLGSRTDLHIFDAGSINGTRYCNEILLPYVRLFRGAMGLQFLFMDDNAPCHRTVAAKQLLESEDIERMDWPARSPDLNPIERLQVSEELGIAQSVISKLWQRFQDDGNVSRCYSTGRPGVTTPNEDGYIWQLLPKETDGAQHQTYLVSSLQLPSDSRRTLIWSAPGTRYHQEKTIERHRYGGAGWLVWGEIILGSRTDLHVQSVTMTVHIYRDVILEQHVRLFRGTMGAECLFMDDKARTHRANIVDECLQSEYITRMDWLAYSPDLNPIKHVWDMIAHRIAARQPPSTCLSELRRALLDEWCNIPQDQIDNLILSMPRRYIKEATGSMSVENLQKNNKFEKNPLLHLKRNTVEEWKVFALMKGMFMTLRKERA